MKDCIFICDDEDNYSLLFQARLDLAAFDLAVGIYKTQKTRCVVKYKNVTYDKTASHSVANIVM